MAGKKCPFCGKDIDFQELLFFAERDGGTNDSNMGIGGFAGAGKGSGFGAGSFGTFDGFAGIDGFDFSTNDTGNMTADAPKNDVDVDDVDVDEVSVDEDNVKKDENNLVLGKWVKDDTYINYLQRFLYYNLANKDNKIESKERYILKWHKEDPVTGIAKGMGMDGSDNFPTYVEISDEDIRQFGNTMTKILNQAMCPHCHCELPIQYLKTPKECCHSVVLVGLPSSGKTVYLLSMLQNMKEYLDTTYNLVQSRVEICAVSSIFFSAMEGEFKDNKGMIATPIDSPIFPILLRLNCDNKDYYVSVHDLPGEAYSNVGNMARLLGDDYISQADSMFVMLAAEQADQGITNTTIGANIELVERGKRLLDTLIPFQRYPTLAQNLKHMAVIITKADLLISGQGTIFGSDSSNGYNTLKACTANDVDDHKGGVNKLVIETVSNEVKNMLGRVIPIYGEDGRLLEDIRNALGEKAKLKGEYIKFFAVSAYQKVGGQYAPCGEANMNRHRIMEPMLYLMNEWGVVKSIQPSGNNEEDDDPSKGGLRGLFSRLFG